MQRKTEHTAVWLQDLSENKMFNDKLSKTFTKNNLLLEKWHHKLAFPLGIIVIDGYHNYEALISLLNIQLKNKCERVIVINSSPDALNRDEVIKILNYGAEYYFELLSLTENFENLIEKILRWRNIESILQSSLVRRSIVGESSLLKKMLRGIIEVAVYSSASVLILGERGTGKELFAKLIHEIDNSRNKEDFVLVDCTTIKKELSGSEFFGHEKGSFTGADYTREGAFALANNGTLFLDEVGELPLTMQAELLRIIQEGTYKKIGSNLWKQTNFRLVCATNRNLELETETGNFRKDLYDRISLWKCYTPSLNERKEDIPLLAEYFFKKNIPEPDLIIDEGIINYLKERNYPGNVRELQNLIKRICLRYVGKGPITMGDISEYDRINFTSFRKNWYEDSNLAELIAEALNEGYDAKSIVDTIKSLTTKIALSLTGSNKEVSQLLGKSERWIQLQKAKEK
ncbi:sigma 54-interacting transcriptional regulator [Flavitalea antarctica]